MVGDYGPGMFQNKEAVDFVEKWKKLKQREPNEFVAPAYDAAKVMMLAIEKVGKDPQKIADFLHHLKKYPGVSGYLSFKPNGDVSKQFVYQVWTGGRVKSIKPVKASFSMD